MSLECPPGFVFRKDRFEVWPHVQAHLVELVFDDLVNNIGWIVEVIRREDLYRVDVSR